jgi:hypothetical protein
MITIIFHEKPGSAESQKQINRVAAAGYEIQTGDLTVEHWTGEPGD